MSQIKGIKSQQCWIDGKLQKATILMANKRIVSIKKGGYNGFMDGIVDCGDSVVMPGVIDTHVHINEPGRADWEGFETGTRAAARGGITTIIDMPLNSSPVVTNVAALEAKIKACSKKLYVNCGFWAGAISPAIAEVKQLIETGCLGVKVFISSSGLDEFPKISIKDLDTLMEGLSNLNVPVLAHCELDSLAVDSPSEVDPRSYNSYLESRPKLWENEAIKIFIDLSQKHNCKAHIVHLASDEILEWLLEKKKMGVPFTVETCPHYVFFNAENIEDGNTLLKCAPPIREKSNGEGLKRALKMGLIDFISSDHSPAPPYLKEIESGDFGKAWGGISSLQFLLSASWTALKNELRVEEFIPLLTSKPAEFLGLDHRIGRLEEGYDADITIWQPEQYFQVHQSIIEHKHKLTPYLDKVLYGNIMTTIVNGQVAYSNQNISNTPYGSLFRNTEKTGLS